VCFIYISQTLHIMWHCAVDFTFMHMWLKVLNDGMNSVYPIQYEHAPLRVRCTMLRKHPPVDPVLSCLSCFRKPSVGVCQVVSNSPYPGIAWPSARFPPDLWRWFEEDTTSICRLIHSGYMAKQREATGLDNRGKWRLLSGMTHIFIPHEIRPFVAKNSSQAPLVQRINSCICYSYLTLLCDPERIDSYFGWGTVTIVLTARC